jgi:hypothetical protein
MPFGILKHSARKRNRPRLSSATVLHCRIEVKFPFVTPAADQVENFSIDRLEAILRIEPTKMIGSLAT